MHVPYSTYVKQLVRGTWSKSNYIWCYKIPGCKKILQQLFHTVLIDEQMKRTCVRCKRGSFYLHTVLSYVLNQGCRSRGCCGGHPQILADQLTLSQPGSKLCPPHYYSPLPPRISKPSNSPGVPWFFSFLVFAFAFLKKFHHFKTLTKN